jgi:hypothetical protein
MRGEFPSLYLTRFDTLLDERFSKENWGLRLHENKTVACKLIQFVTHLKLQPRKIHVEKRRIDIIFVLVFLITNCRYISTWMNFFTESAMIRPTLSARIASSLDSTYHSSTSSDDFVNDLTNDSFTNHWSSHWSHHRTSLSDDILWLCDESIV